jgi:hypothetical protein
VLQDLRTRWAGRIELVITSLASVADLEDPARAATIAAAVAEGGGVLGWFVYPGAPVHLLPRAFDLAERHGLRLDFHVDEHLEPPRPNLPHVARLASERGWGARTVCGHCCVLGVLETGERDALLDEVAASGLGLVSLPWTNLYLQDNASDPAHGGRRTPRRRGLLPVHEARSSPGATSTRCRPWRWPRWPRTWTTPCATGPTPSPARARPCSAWAGTACCGPARRPTWSSTPGATASRSSAAPPTAAASSAPGACWPGPRQCRRISASSTGCGAEGPG